METGGKIMVEVYAIKILEVQKFLDHKETMLSLVDEKRRERILKFKFNNDAQRSLLGDMMLRFIISQKLNLDNDKINFTISDKGKSSLKDHPELHFNVSHAGNWAVAAFSEQNVGIDVEIIKNIKYNIAEQFFSSVEIMALNKLEGKDKLEFFFILWTMKESYLKYTGKGLSEPLNSFTITKTGNSFTLSHHKINEKVFLKQYYLDGGYKLAVCSAIDSFNKEIIKLNIEAVIGSLKK